MPFGSDPTTYAYDKADRIKTITYRNQSVAYTYDTAGRLVSRTLPNGLTQAFAYDAANQLLSMTYIKSSNTVLETVSYTYNENGNRITRNRTQLGSVPETPFTATYDANNRMLTYNGQPLTYDDNGNLVSRQTPQGMITYTWDAQNRLIGISGPNGTAAFKYDAQGRRIEKTINGATTAYLYDGAQAIAELQGSSIGATYLTGLQIDEVLARYANAGNRTLLTDALGSVLSLTDDTQTAQTIYGYSPYGEQTQVGENNNNTLQYTGRENDNTGLYYYRARYYDPTLKRFIASDPIGLAGGLNTYAYANLNPLRFTDPTGLDPTVIIIETGQIGQPGKNDASVIVLGGANGLISPAYPGSSLPGKPDRCATVKGGIYDYKAEFSKKYNTTVLRTPGDVPVVGGVNSNPNSDSAQGRAPAGTANGVLNHPSYTSPDNGLCGCTGVRNDSYDEYISNFKSGDAGNIVVIRIPSFSFK